MTQRVNATIHIFRAGRHIDGSGVARAFTHDDIHRMAASYQEHKRPAPVVLGHPPDDRPAYGMVGGLIARGGDLLAKLWFTPSMAQAIKDGAYRKVSAAFFPPAASENPVPGAWYLRHVGMLGAEPPAVKGLAPMTFSEDGAVWFGEGTIVNLNSSGDDMKHDNFDPARLAMHRTIQRRMDSQQGLTYAEAARQVDAEIEFGEGGTFSEKPRDIGAFDPDRVALNSKILAYQRQHAGVSYSVAAHAVIRLSA